MADQDQGRFDQSLLTGAEKLLNDEGRADLANQLDTLFTEVKAGNKLSDGMAEYQARLGAMLGAEVDREVRNPNLPHLQAERAFRDAAKDHGIPLPSAFDTVASDFHPLKSVGPNLRANVRFCRSIEGNLPVATCTVSKVAAVFAPCRSVPTAPAPPLTSRNC
jgi:hypothetical protein